MTDRDKAIRILEGNYKSFVLRHKGELITVNELLALLKAQESIEARLHLCESCTKEYPECDATIDGIEFGCGVGNDNIIGCTAYVNRWKAQEPRVMTLEEAQGADYCWYESRTANICILCSAVMYHKSNGKPKTEFQQMGTEILGFQYDDEYGKRWRCWDKEPTRALREATPWDAQGQRDYEAAVEMAEYCERYEPTYNADDGSM